MLFLNLRLGLPGFLHQICVCMAVLAHATTCSAPFVDPITFGDVCKSWSSWLCSFLRLVGQITRPNPMSVVTSRKALDFCSDWMFSFVRLHSCRMALFRSFWTVVFAIKVRIHKTVALPRTWERTRNTSYSPDRVGIPDGPLSNPSPWD